MTFQGWLTGALWSHMWHQRLVLGSLDLPDLTLSFGHPTMVAPSSAKFEANQANGDVLTCKSGYQGSKIQEMVVAIAILIRPRLSINVRRPRLLVMIRRY